MTSPFACLTDGAALFSLLERCNAASGQIPTNPTPAQGTGGRRVGRGYSAAVRRKRERQSLPAHLSRTTTSASGL